MSITFSVLFVKLASVIFQDIYIAWCIKNLSETILCYDSFKYKYNLF